jgi:hypothetical protein
VNGGPLHRSGSLVHLGNNAPKDRRKDMKRRTYIVAVVFLVIFGGISAAQDYPIMDMVANNVIQKYQNSTCEQLWEQKSKPKSPKEQEFIQILKADPQMRTAFINKVAAPIVNKMFECGMIP